MARPPLRLQALVLALITIAVFWHRMACTPAADDALDIGLHRRDAARSDTTASSSSSSIKADSSSSSSNRESKDQNRNQQPPPPPPPSPPPAPSSSSSELAPLPVTALLPRETRRERARGSLPDLFEHLPEKFEPGLRNPCWYNATAREQEKREVLLCVPYFFLLGQVKCGTTDLWDFINRHPRINSGGVFKEQHWLSRASKVDGAGYIGRFSRFARLVQRGNTDIVAGDGTPDTIWDRVRGRNYPYNPGNRGAPHQRIQTALAEVVAELNPAARLILILRDPVERLWSDFFYFAHRPEHEISLPPEGQLTAEHFHQYAERAIGIFNECLEEHPARECAWTVRGRLYAGQTRLVMGLYWPFVMEYLANFEREQLLVLTLEEYKADRRAALERVFAHLKAAQPSEAEWTVILKQDQAVNQQGARYRELKMLDKTRQLLRDFYAPWNTDLARLLGQPRFLNWNQGRPAV